MDAKKIITVLLLVFVAISIAALAMKDKGAPNEAQQTAAGRQDTAVPQPQGGAEYAVTYFHTDVRCASCVKIEAWTKSEVEQAFAAEIADGKLAWRMVNYESEGNEHYAKEYGLITKSVVLMHYVNGKQKSWKNLDRIWDLLGNEQEFRAYIREGLEEFIVAEQALVKADQG